MIDPNDPTTAALLRGIAGQYTLEREIGRGGMGVVYLATDDQLERPVAIKTLPQHLAADPRVRTRFLREARTAGALSHPNIVPVYTAAEREGVVYFAMRYINGESLADRITRSGSLDPGEVVSLLRQLASALVYAHANGVVHRDIKAENVLLDSETGRAMLTDFGIARLTEVQPLTATGTVLGTVQYMSPEQVSGETLDGRSDLYSLGILAFYALCGRFPFERPTASAIVVAHVTSAPPKVCSLATGVPSALGDIVDRLLAKSPADRYADGHALRDALDTLPIEATQLVGRASTSPTSDVGTVLSSDEAQQVWARAAELQANTGVIVPPAEFRVRGDNAPLETVGYDTTLVRGSAIDAGIDARYVDRALAERHAVVRQSSGAIAANDAPVAIATKATSSKINPVIGAPVRIDLEASFDGELSDTGFEEIADEFRRSLGEMVNVSTVGRSLTATAATDPGGRNGIPRRLQIHVSSRNGRTTVRAFEDMTQLANAMMYGITMGGGFGGGSIMIGIIMGTTHNGALAIAGIASTLTIAYSLARRLYGRSSRKREREVREVLERVVRRGKELAADDAKRLPGRR